MNLLQHILIGLLRGYRALISPALAGLFGGMGFGCRFAPTCSQYALEAVRLHGAVRGSIFALRRIGRCHPWGGAGDDPVPVPQRGSGRGHAAVPGGPVTTAGVVPASNGVPPTQLPTRFSNGS